MSTGNLELPQITTTQDQKEQTSNDADAKLENALSSIFSVNLTSGDVTLTNNQFENGMTFDGTGHTVARNLTIPARERAIFFVKNSGTGVIHTKIGTTSVDVAVGTMQQFYADGTTNGLFAVGSASPNVAYFGTGAPSTLHNEGDTYYDTSASPYNKYVQHSGAWHAVGGSGGGGGGGGTGIPTIVQNKAAAGSSIQGVTMGAAPTDGNILVAFVTGGIFTANTDWFRLQAQDGGGSTFTNVFWKIAASETTTVNPLSATHNASMVVYEISGGVPFFEMQFFTGSGTAEAININAPGQTLSPGSLIIGAVLNDTNGVQPTSITGASADDAATDSTARAATGFHVAAPSNGANTVTANYSGSTSSRIVGVNVLPIPGGIPSPTIVQHAENAGSAIQGVTFSNAPAAGSLLIAIQTCTSNPGPDSANGWATLFLDGSGFDFTTVYWKVCQSGESATQNPYTSTQNAAMVMYEIANVGGTPLHANNVSTTTTQTISFTAPGTGIVIGAAGGDHNNNSPSSFTGASADGIATGGGSSQDLQGFHQTAAPGSVSVTANYGSSVANRIVMVFLQ